MPVDAPSGNAGGAVPICRWAAVLLRAVSDQEEDNPQPACEYHRNQIALYSWIILKCCHFVVTGQFRNAKVQHFQGFAAFRVLFPLLKLSVNSCVLRSIYCIWRCRQSPYSIISLQSTSIIASKIASDCVKICCCTLNGNYTVFLLPEDIFVKFGTGLKDIGLLANSAFFLSISAIAISRLKPI